MTLVGPPPPQPFNPFAVMVDDVRKERANRVPYPPGETSFSMARTRRFAHEPLGLLLECYERYGPVFTIKVLHGNVVFMLGPAANHYMTVSHASNFTWRESHFRDLIGLLGDGLLTIDGDFHRRSRQIMLPAFHRERIAAVDRGDDAGDRARSARSSRRGRAWTCTLDAAAGDEDRDAGAVRAWTPTGSPRGAQMPRAYSSRRCRSTPPNTPRASCAAPSRRGHACGAQRGAWTR